MKKVEKYIFIVIGIIIGGVIASGITYMLVTKDSDNNKTNENNKENNNTNNNNDNNENNEVVLNDGVELISIKEENDKIVETFKVVLNGKEKELKVEFEFNYLEYYGDDNWLEITGNFNNSTFYYIGAGNYSEEEYFNINNLKSEFNENNFRLIKGDDNKNYLLIISYENGDYYNLYILNDELEIINKKFDYVGRDETTNATNGMVIENRSYWELDTEYPKYMDQFKVCKDMGCQLKLKIENNKIYYLCPILNSELIEGNMGILEERVYTINNNKLEYEVINRYKIINGAGEI